MSFDHEQNRSREVEESVAMPEVSEAIKATFLRLKRPVILACGDDRGCMEESADQLTKDGLPMDYAFARIFGGKYGAANILSVAVTAQHGPDYLREQFGTDFFAFSDEVSNRAAEFGVIMAAHSSDHNEGGASSLQHSSDPLGCARVSALGQVNHLAATEQLVARVAEDDSEAAFGSINDSRIRELPYAYAQASAIFFGDNPANFAVERDELFSSKTPTMVLKGDHAKSEDAIHVLNLSSDHISDVNEAVARGLHYYDSDIVLVAETLLRSFPELNLDPRILLDVMMLDEAATRMALDGSDPQKIESQRYGDGQQALEYLASI